MELESQVDRLGASQVTSKEKTEIEELRRG